MKTVNQSFLAFADRRFRLSGRALIENGHPYFVPTDGLQAQADQWPQGYLSMSHYDYLGLMHHPATTGAAKAAIEAQGTGVGASRLVGGERLAHRALEEDLADFLGVGGVLSIISGYLTNVSVIGLLCGPRDLVLVDELSHNSIMVGARSCKAHVETFAHNDLDDLERLLREHRAEYGRVLICTDALFSMDGDITDLPRLLDMKDAYDAWLLLDEAHSYGVLGTTGRGLCEHFGEDPNRVEVAIGTLSKSFASSGGFIAANADVIEWMRFCLPGFVYSVGLGPSTVASAHAALRLLRSEPDRVTTLRSNSQYFLKRAAEAGLDTGTAIGEAVVPILFETPEDCVFVADALMAQGIYAPPVVHVGVPKDMPRIRFFISAAHSPEDLDRVIAAVEKAAQAATALRRRMSAE
ncbi:aminotransferase class I/II-fold pyridoxal phosphate-dependent enzyme [Shimia marina]|uniref:8-amino-7-oxononanoate synthase n=1 Tax=Shimia marina TaxID=321267 RepID=A0A0P1ELC1_9RHOB|nr:aminotransferase class I/II-fold pyridoxal phosphate-dependent enzyme [Shimia marina]CUH51250.1 8-amino-7-oxononanoate synthase [Shimia marina]SFD53983.1 Aminotransferase class I and II [Shimia marina]